MDSYLYVKNNENIQISKIGNVEEVLAISEGTSSQFPCEGIFGYGLETFKAETIEGPIIMTDGEHYNMTNPYYLVYSDDHSFRRFTKDQYQMMETFASYKQPDWDIPTIQIVLIMIGVITLVLILAYFIYFLFKRFIPHVKDNLDRSI